MAGKVGRPEGSTVTKPRKKSERKIMPDKHVPIPVIEDDYRAVKKDITKKISSLTLKYLREKGIVKAPYYSVYKIISERVEDRKMNIDRSVIEHVNNKFIDYYESI